MNLRKAQRNRSICFFASEAMAPENKPPLSVSMACRHPPISPPPLEVVYFSACPRYGSGYRVVNRKGDFRSHTECQEHWQNYGPISLSPLSSA